MRQISWTFYAKNIEISFQVVNMTCISSYLVNLRWIMANTLASSKYEAEDFCLWEKFVYIDTAETVTQKTKSSNQIARTKLYYFIRSFVIGISNIRLRHFNLSNIIRKAVYTAWLFKTKNAPLKKKNFFNIIYSPRRKKVAVNMSSYSWWVMKTLSIILFTCNLISSLSLY